MLIDTLKDSLIYAFLVEDEFSKPVIIVTD